MKRSYIRLIIIVSLLPYYIHSKSVWGKITSGAKSVTKSVSNGVTSVAKDAGNSIADAAKDAGNGIADVTKDMNNTIYDGIVDLGNMIADSDLADAGYVIKDGVIDFGNTAEDIANISKDFIVDQSANALDLLTQGVNYLKDIVNIKKYIRSKYPVRRNIPDEQLQVRQGLELCPRELNFLKNRQPIVTKALKTHFNIDTPLNIALCFSGGGSRAMLTSLGFLLEAEKMGLYDASLYTIALSGSSWTVCPFAALSAKQNMSLTGFKDQLVNRLEHIMKVIVPGTPPVPVFTEYENRSMQNNLIKRFSYDQYLSSIDLYAAFIGDFTLKQLGSNRLDATWSSIADPMELGKIPLPIGSAIQYKDSSHGKTEYYWFEVGPFEVGSQQIQAYIPTIAFGAEYKNGKLYSGYSGHTHEYPISFYEGVFGSAFAVSINELLDKMPNPKIVMPGFTITEVISKKKIKVPDVTVTIPIKDWLDDNTLSDMVFENLRLSPATFHNYTRGLSQNSLRKDDKIKLFDAGIDSNFPVPIAMHPGRNIDVIFIGDASFDMRSLDSTDQHFKRNNIKFPKIGSLSKASLNKPLTILNDPRDPNYDKTMVTVFYCPFVKNDAYSIDFDPSKCRDSGYCTTLNFNYTQAQAEEVINLTRLNLHSVQDEIKVVLKALELAKKTIVPATVLQ